MNKFRWIVILLKTSIAALGLILVSIIVLPLLMHSSKSSLTTNVEIISDSNVNVAYDWVVNYTKSNNNVSENADVMFVSSAQNLQKNVFDKITHNTVVFEMLFNQIAGNKTLKDNLKSVTGVNYSGYIGRTFSDLSMIDGIPSKIIETYEAQNKVKWRFYGEGIIVYNEDSVIVLVKGVDYDGQLMITMDDQSFPFSGYFEITNGHSDELAQFVLDSTAKGTEKLKTVNLSNTFPALYYNQNNLFASYYFAGKFSEYATNAPYQFEGIDWIMRNKILYDAQTNEKIYWKWFLPKLVEITKNANENQFLSNNMFDDNPEKLFAVVDKSIVKRDVNGEMRPFFIKGINLGSALPGKTFTEFPKDKMIYYDWLTQMHDLNVNTLRIYTLLPPEFYEALYEFNHINDDPIYLLQEVWPEENPQDSNYLDDAYNTIYKKEIEMSIGAIHGNINIPQRNFRAFGIYKTDVSDYLLGYLIGREMEPEEVLQTDEINGGYAFSGEYFYSNLQASPTEGWLAGSCDYALTIEKNDYGNSPLVAIVSWPTLDSIEHDSEWNETGNKDLQYNDKAVVDINHIGIHEDKISGFFGAYHIYPNYPDFMNLDPTYDAYLDAEGRFRYGGYLKDFMAHQEKYPAIVAEYGISTSMYTAHFNPDGYDHGGLTEIDQATGIIRMTKAIVNEGYSGAIIFEWMDEWVKKTWTTEPYMIPYDRNALWHNLMDPEQNYGLLAYGSYDFDAQDIKVFPFENEQITNIKTIQNAAYLELDITFDSKLATQAPFQIGVDTIPELIQQNIYEFVIYINDEPEILVNPGYNWTKGKYSAVDVPFEQYEQMLRLTNKENTTKDGVYSSALYQNVSTLKIGSFDNPTCQIDISGNHVKVKSPYTLLGISDPSSKMVLDDEAVVVTTEQDAVKTTQIDKITYAIKMNDVTFKFEQILNEWDSPNFKVQFKNSYKAISEYFKSIP